ncbi:Ochratoxinase [Gnomoniopsis smithogilvyi]|uniref:Ochratoxinase n=1 Tax=Gnomoniopsis smithogilvyi TaxID=1191159 RepID=A0A9W8YZ98_9PEZI|nr:Ochratoxinase [Gnomoniopsis smithogilvyi]
MTRRTLQENLVSDAGRVNADTENSVGEEPLTMDMPTRLAGTASKFPAQVFSTAYGMTIKSSEIKPVKKQYYTIIKAGLLIPGADDPFENAALVISNRIIAWIGLQSDIPEKYTAASHRSYDVPYLMPGLWEVHAHFMGASATGDDGPGYVPIIATHPASAGARLARGCWEALQRGYTSMRDVAGMGCEVAKAINDGEIVGPNIYSSGACLSQTAGHGDVFNLPADVVYQNLGVASISSGHFGTGSSCIVDGVDECRRAVRLQIRRGAKCIKVLASGGVMSRDDDVRYAQFSQEELDVIVAEAARQGRSVAAHVHAKDGVLAAIKAGVTTLEHLSFADQECIDLIKEKGIICVPTRYVTEMLLSTGGKGLDQYTWEKVKLCGKNHLAMYKLAIKSGCIVAMGTDTAPGMNVAVELEYAVEAGMSNLEAIKAATVHGALTVGAQALKTGQLRVGYEADVLGLTANPVQDVRVLQDKDNIKWVWKGGKIYKGPGVGPWGEEQWWGDS